MEKEISKGSTREDIKARKKIIGDYYASWIEAHPDKKVWNKSLHAYIHVKFQSINETKGHASVSYESTCAVLKYAYWLAIRKAQMNTFNTVWEKKIKPAWDADFRARIKLP